MWETNGVGMLSVWVVGKNYKFGIFRGDISTELGYWGSWDSLEKFIFKTNGSKKKLHQLAALPDRCPRPGEMG